MFKHLAYGTDQKNVSSVGWLSSALQIFGGSGPFDAFHWSQLLAQRVQSTAGEHVIDVNMWEHESVVTFIMKLEWLTFLKSLFYSHWSYASLVSYSLPTIHPNHLPITAVC